MLKSHRVIRAVTEIVKDASNSIAERVIKLHPDPKGREEIISSQLGSEITLHLLDEIQERLDGRTISNVKFQVYLFKKKEEKVIGADIAGILEMNVKGRKVVKSYLAQAKVAQASKGVFDESFIKCTDPRLLGQVNDMLRISSSSYVFLYSTQGIDVVSAQAVKLANTNSISTALLYSHKLGDFYEEFFKCFIGDSLLSPPYLRSDDLGVFADQVNAQNVLTIRTTAN